jgi:hypothetical protein
MKRQWLIAAALVALAGVAISCGDDGGDADPAEDEGATRRRVAEALTSGLDFEGGVERLEPMPDTTDEDLVIEQDSAPIDLEPGVASLLPFDIENPDEEDPVVATLLQFEDGEEDKHIEVDLELEDGATMGEVMFEVADSVCDTLCADSFAVRLIQALKTRGGRIGARVTRNLLLTCEQDGQDAMCESAEPGGDGDGDGDTGGDGDGDGVLDTVDDIANYSRAVNMALCDCSGGVNCTQHRWITQAEIDCLRAAIAEDPTNDAENLRQLATALARSSTVSAISGACNAMGVFDILAPTPDLQDLPEDILACDEEMDTFFPAAGVDAGVVPAP